MFSFALAVEKDAQLRDSFVSSLNTAEPQDPSFLFVFWYSVLFLNVFLKKKSALFCRQPHYGIKEDFHRALRLCVLLEFLFNYQQQVFIADP